MILDHYGRPIAAAAPTPKPSRSVIRARYDAAQTTDRNQNHWAQADANSADAANSAAIRATLRNRSRYEIANNSYATGLTATLADGLIGTGPRLQVLTDVERDADDLEELWREWSETINLAATLRTMRVAKITDGEAFAFLVSNPNTANPVQLDLRLVEPEQVASPWGETADQPVDGIIIDPWGYPAHYQLLRSHPGEWGSGHWGEFDLVAASNVLHYFTPSRPGQHRGIPELTAALPLFALLRRYCLAVLGAAETAADLSLVVQTTLPPDTEGGVAITADETIELVRGAATFLPEGYTLGQAKPEQPTTTFGDFVRQILTQIGRCVGVPYNILAGDSSSFNYASGRLDHQTYFKSIRVEQSRIRAQVLDRIFQAWFAEARLIRGYLPASFRDAMAVPHGWFFDGYEHVDPQKEADADDVRLQNHTTTYAEIYGKRGRDWRVELEQRGKEAALLKSIGLSAAPPARPPRAQTAPPDPAESPDAADPAETEDA